MQAWVLSGFGDRSQLAYTAWPAPELRPGEALVEVRAAALNFADGLMIAGRYQLRPAPPFVLGAELAGVVVATTPGSTFRAGDRVAAQVWTGAYGQYCAVDEGRLIRLPEGLSFAEGTALPVSYTTAHIALFQEGRLTPGQTVLVHAAAGGVGGAAVQLARAGGARVIATASSDEKLAIAQAHGAEALINYRESGWTDEVRRLCPDGVDLVVDPVGGQTTLDSIGLLGWRGRILLIGFASGAPAQLPANRLLVKAAAAMGGLLGLCQRPSPGDRRTGRAGRARGPRPAPSTHWRPVSRERLLRGA
ncbi:NADPH:quinone oxidoreductase family protein [Phenylobacterium sp. J367]|uniref:NADPH:quinone oxidoreductase family protein n=1 Tax=Phenylobacterium sp. J367 TaxID=2898435 RepID=UPI002151E6BC|nr:NADPH:quinone oxidoreductase family protein [Phenylobacterium sp. J367]MCR5879625.1 NADPH:quinone oxidoreductase family protein [Phenylobacterium sp. J367]